MKPIDPQAALEAIWKLGPAHAKAKGQLRWVEEYRPSLKSILMKKHLDLALGAQEREAYADPQYQEHLKAIDAAVEQEQALRWKLVAAQAAIEIWRSQEASNRAMDRAAT